MNISEYLNTHMSDHNFKKREEQYSYFGGSRTLRMAVRNFYNVCSSGQTPSPTLLMQMFKKAKPSQRKDVVIAFFKTFLSNEEHADLLLNYLSENLSLDIDHSQKSLWDTRSDFSVYTEEQLDYMNQNPIAFRVHNNVLLNLKIHKSKIHAPKGILEELERLNLVSIQKNYLLSPSILYRVPTFQNDRPQSVLQASHFITNMINNYVSREGTPKQVLSFALQHVRPHIAQKFSEQLVILKNWIQRHAVQETGPNVVPFVTVMFSKQLSDNEL